ncbi:MAG TPA: 50S ribosomal protein L30 [Candidatus Nanoarchaeia archaeon]|nr:50S ribosomal protein L30 [Candidatus Nanoarchaeia archaeon]
MKIAIVQIRGTIRTHRKIKDTLNILKLRKKNSCIITDNSLIIVGMLNIIKDYVTWGEVNEDVIKELLVKRGKVVGDKPLTEEYLKRNAKISFDEFTKKFVENKIKLREIPGLKPYFRLKPPKKGFERYGIKMPYSMGGALGYRKENINDLVKRMI